MNINRFSGRVIGCVLIQVLVQTVGHAAPFPLAQEPRDASVEQPAPNVIVSVDNSYSMRWSSRASDGSRNPPNGVPTRLAALKKALKSNFSEAKIPDRRIRLAWQAMNHTTTESCVGFSPDEKAAADYRASSCVIDGTANANLLRPFKGAHRKNFMTWVDALHADGGTPMHAMMVRAGEYMKTTGRLSPYSDDPGVEGASQSSCRKSFHIFMTDGEYTLFGFRNGPKTFGIPDIGNADGTGRDLPGGIRYEPRAPYADYAGAKIEAHPWTKGEDGVWRPTEEYRPTLADLAFHYWAIDLQPQVPDNVNKLDEPKYLASNSEYWNPRNDPANWQHLRTHTIGFGSASSWTGRPAFDSKASQPTYSKDFAALAAGTLAWPNPLDGTRPKNAPLLRWDEAGFSFGFDYDAFNPSIVRMDLWHAAINGRGRFLPAANAGALNDAFESILAPLGSEPSKSRTSISANASKISTSTTAYRAGYDTGDWSGMLTASRFGEKAQLQNETIWDARVLLDERMAETGAHVTREVLSFSSTEAGGSGIPFLWDSLSVAQQDALAGAANSAADEEKKTHGQGVLDFLRGDRSEEGPGGDDFRERDHVLGDIVGSSLWYAGQPSSGFTRDAYASFAAKPRKAMVYVGANDGMLHAFDAEDGIEAFAYVPAGLYGTADAPVLKRLSEQAYLHRYYVDGSPFVADIYMGSDDSEPKENFWKSVLVGTLGAGGRGYFVLDVTNPENVLERDAASVVLADTTALADDDLGHQFQQPALDSFSRRAVQVASLNNGRRALILGNGYNSKNEKAILWIHYLDGDKSILKIPAPASQVAGAANGLSAPRPMDRNGDGQIDIVYAGDLLGNLWKFDLSGAESSSWKALDSSATASGLKKLPLFAAGVTQPITAAPVVVDHPMGGYMVVFGTGQLFAQGDESTTSAQYLYGIWDRAGAVSDAVALTDLVQQSIDTETVNDLSAEAGEARFGTEFRTVSNNSVRYRGESGKRGWYLQLPTGKERIVYPGDVLSSSVGLFSTTIPGTAADRVDCTPGTPDDGWTLLIDFFSGSAPDGIVYADFAAAGIYLGYRNYSGRDDLGFRPPGDGKNADVICNAAGDCTNVKRPDAIRRFGWRNLFSSN
jgi:type IV pilus assembly protein PilY1